MLEGPHSRVSDGRMLVTQLQPRGMDFEKEWRAKASATAAGFCLSVS